MSAIGILSLCVSVWVYVCVLCVVHAYKNTVECVGVVCWLNCMHVLALWACDRCGMFRHVVCVCVRACECMRVLHTLRTHLMHCTSHPVPAETGCD